MAALLLPLSRADATWSPTSRGRDLDALLSFKTPATCEPGKRLNRLIDSIYVFDAEGLPTAAERARAGPYAAAVGKPRQIEKAEVDNYSVFEIALAGTWLGLPVAKLRRSIGHENGISGMSIEFKAPLPQVHSALNRSGFAIPASLRREIHQNEVVDPIVISLTSANEVTTLKCDWST